MMFSFTAGADVGLDRLNRASLKRASVSGVNFALGVDSREGWTLKWTGLLVRSPFLAGWCNKPRLPVDATSPRPSFGFECFLSGQFLSGKIPFTDATHTT